MRMVDLDGSGIMSYLSATRNYHAESRQANYLLLNDGTGKLHVALHDEFVNLGRQVNAYAANLYNDQASLSVDANGQLPKFQGYLTADGKLNYVAEVATYQLVNGMDSGDKIWGNISSVLVNVPLSIDIRRDFITAIDVADRNGSKLIRTFAGNDTFSQINAAAATHIDGGLGIDTSIYLGKFSDFSLSKTITGFNVSGSRLADTLLNVERLKFADTNVALDVLGHAGTTAKILGAVFGKAAVANKEYAGIGLNLLDGGMSYLDLMQLAINAKLGASVSHATVVKLLYENVVGSPPPADELAFYHGLLDSGTHTQASLGVLAADTVLNTDKINLAGLATSGLEYLPWG